MIVALFVAGFVVAFFVGYFLAVARTPALIARMSKDELRALADRAFGPKNGG